MIRQLFNWRTIITLIAVAIVTGTIFYSNFLAKKIAAEERRKVNQQEGKTPGRRGEQIKQEEIDKEIVRREMLKQKSKNETNERN